jgi:hypothetical protein
MKHPHRDGVAEQTPPWHLRMMANNGVQLLPPQGVLPQSVLSAAGAPLVHVGTPGVRHAMTPAAQGALELVLHGFPAPGQLDTHEPPVLHVPPGQLRPLGS